jgi:hypothetical protein
LAKLDFVRKLRPKRIHKIGPRVTTKVAVNALLGDTPALQDYGTAIMHNLGTKEVKAVVCIDPVSNRFLEQCNYIHTYFYILYLFCIY